MKVYVASSWKNEAAQQAVVKALRAAGHEVYDFRNPPGGTGFSWSSVAPSWREWTPAEYRQALLHPLAVRGFASDMNALRECEACVLVAPCGSSAHMELAYAVGAGKLTVALLAEGREAELMLCMADVLALNMAEVLAALEEAPTPASTAHVANRCQVRSEGQQRALEALERVFYWLALGEEGPEAELPCSMEVMESKEGAQLLEEVRLAARGLGGLREAEEVEEQSPGVAAGEKGGTR